MFFLLEYRPTYGSIFILIYLIWSRTKPIQLLFNLIWLLCINELARTYAEMETAFTVE